MTPENSSTPQSGSRTLLIGTRASTLASTQTSTVQASLESFGHLAELHFVHTPGDASQKSQTPVSRIGVGVFTETLRNALYDGDCDVAVHSFKDLPTAPDPRFVAVVPPRVDPREVLVSFGDLTLRTLPNGARIGTGAPRRIAQIRALRPDLDIVGLRGNIDTRMGKVGARAEDLAAVVLARAGLERVGRLSGASEEISVDDILPAPAQGALCVEVRADDTEAVAAVLALDHPASHAAAVAERAVLATLEAGCTAPVGAWSQWVGHTPGILELRAGVFALDGSRRLVREVTGEVDLTDIGNDPVHPRWREAARLLGVSLGEQLLAAGAAALMADDGPHEARP